jgi:hypothetical protein
MPGTGRDDESARDEERDCDEEPDPDEEPGPDEEPSVALAVPHPASMSPARTAPAQHSVALLRAGRPASTKRMASHLTP